MVPLVPAAKTPTWLPVEVAPGAEVSFPPRLFQLDHVEPFHTF